MQDNGYDEQRYESRDQRAETATTFYESDINSLNVSERRKKELRRALRRQEGEDYGETYSGGEDSREQRKQQNRREWKRRVITTYAANLDMTHAQRERAEHLLMDVVTVNTFGYYSSEQVALGILAAVAREDGWAIDKEAQFKRLMVENDLGNLDDGADMDKIEKLREMVRERVPSMEK